MATHDVMRQTQTAMDQVRARVRQGLRESCESYEKQTGAHTFCIALSALLLLWRCQEFDERVGGWREGALTHGEGEVASMLCAVNVDCLC